MAKNLTQEEKAEILRLRIIRDNLGYSQEQFADLIDISISAYKKIESYDNRISLSVLKKIKRNLSVSADYIIDGEPTQTEDLWKALINCTEEDKMQIFLRLNHYFINNKKRVFPTKEEQLNYIDKIIAYSNELQKSENRDDT